MTRPLHVLFVDDDPGDVELECIILRRDFAVDRTIVDTGGEFVAALGDTRFEIILCDYSMPRFSGMEALELWQNAGARIPFIFVTGRLSEEVAVECIKAGATDYVLKGNLTRLPMAVDRALREFEAARALYQAEAERGRVAAAVDQSEEAVVITDPDGAIVYVNPAFTRVTGYTADDSIGQTPRFLRSGRQDREFYAEMWRRIKAGEVWRGALINRRRDESLYDAEMTIAPIFDESGRIVNFCAIHRDVSPRVAAELHLRNLYAQLAETDRLKDEFLAAFSHELRTPLNVIIGYADVLAETLASNLDGESARFLEGIARSTLRLTKLINETLDLARLRIDAIQPLFVATDLCSLVREAAEDFVNLAADKGLSLECAVPGAPIKVTTDPLRFRQILGYLIDNAVKFTERGEVSVGLRDEGETVAVEVRDTGIGLAPSDVSLIFDDFRQLDGSTTRLYGGCGLGLALARRLANLVDGAIEVESELGQGSCFRVRIPRDRSAASVQSTAGPA